MAFRGVVVTSDGKPVEGAEVLLAQGSIPAAAYGSQRDGVLSVRTTADGTFELPARTDAMAIVVRADQGYAQMRVDELNKPGGRIELMPWGADRRDVARGGH